MRRLMLLLSLVAALFGTPLRQAEAADDLARTFAEADSGDNLEECDGGVGDDSDASLEPACVPPVHAHAALTDGLLPPLPPHPCPSPPVLARKADRAWPHPVVSSQRLAWLQRLLF